MLVHNLLRVLAPAHKFNDCWKLFMDEIAERVEGDLTDKELTILAQSINSVKLKEQDLENQKATLLKGMLETHLKRTVNS